MDCSQNGIRRFEIRLWLQAFLFVAWGLVCQVHAQSANLEDPLAGLIGRQNSDKAVFTATLNPSTAKPGDEVTLTVAAMLPPNSYIYATTGDFDARTKITTTKIEGLDVIDEEFQPDQAPETKMDEILKQKLSKFHGSVKWSKQFRVAEGAVPENVAIDLELTGQYCSEGVGGTCKPINPPIALHAKLVETQDQKKPVASFQTKKRPKRGKTNPVELKIQIAPTKASGGKIVKLAITMVLDKGWHTFSTTFKGEGGTATEIAFDKIYGLKRIGSGVVPNRPPEIKVEESLGLRQEVYHDEVTWIQEFELLPDAKPRRFGVEGTITYQTCKESCLPPRSEAFVIGVTSDDVEAPETIDFFEEPKVAAVEPTKVSRPQDKGLLFFLLTAVVAALAALCTPCVFPMVPITVSFFLKQNESKRGRPIVLAVVFSAAIIASFVVIGVGIAAVFGATKPNELANNWILNLFLASIFFTFALNMLGAFEIQIPSWLLNLTASGEQTGGYVGVVFMALTFVLTSFSCTFAFVGSLLAAAAQGEYYWPVLGMLAFGTTFAAPFFFLALMPGTLKSLPRSGGWLNAVKVVMGFVELGVAVKYISVVDQQWNSIPWLFDFTNVMTLWSVLSICTGLYLLGQFRLSHDSPVQGLSPVRVLFAVGFLILGGLFGIGVTQPLRETWLVNQLVAFAPARLDGEEIEQDFEKAVELATSSNKPLFVDFTGVNCVNCRLMEITMARSKNQIRLLKCVQVQVYCDSIPKASDRVEAERQLAKNVALQSGWFGDVTLPAYAVVTSDGKTVLSSFFGTEKRDGDFASFLDEGLKKWRSLKGE